MSTPSRKPPRVLLALVVGAVVVVVGLVVGLVVGSRFGRTDVRTGGKCSLPTASVSYQELQCHPEAHLFYPGAQIFQRLGASQSTDESGSSNPAFSGAIMVSPASPAAVYAWYDAWLTARGWYRGPLLGAGYVSSHGYARTPGTEAFDVDMDDPSRLSATLGEPVPAGGTVFEVRYLLYPYKPGQKPAPSCPPTPVGTGLVSPFYCNP